VLLKMLIKIIRSVMLFNLTFNNVTKKLPPGFSLFFSLVLPASYFAIRVVCLVSHS
jgi:hypothetical protein